MSDKEKRCMLCACAILLLLVATFFAVLAGNMLAHMNGAAPTSLFFALLLQWAAYKVARRARL